MVKRPTRLIIGTGNPGDKYISCRSNIGFKILDVIANNNNISIRTKKKKSLIGMGGFEGKDIVFLKPQTFAELSGESALYIASFLRIDLLLLFAITSRILKPILDLQLIYLSPGLPVPMMSLVGLLTII